MTPKRSVISISSQEIFSASKVGECPGPLPLDQLAVTCSRSSCAASATSCLRSQRGLSQSLVFVMGPQSHSGIHTSNTRQVHELCNARSRNAGHKARREAVGFQTCVWHGHELTVNRCCKCVLTSVLLRECDNRTVVATFTDQRILAASEIRVFVYLWYCMRVHGNSAHVRMQITRTDQKLISE